MDTRDPRFVNAYNDLVGAFFRFINVVNPAPTKEDQIRLICSSMSTLIDMIKGDVDHLNQSEDGNLVTQTTPGPEHRSEGLETSSHAGDTVNVNSALSDPDFPEKRYAKDPTYTDDEVYEFISRQFKREDAWRDLESDEREEYMFIVEFDATEGNGRFYLNKDAYLVGLFEGGQDSSVVKLEGMPNLNNMRVVSTGKIEKSNRGWEIVEPLIIGKK